LKEETYDLVLSDFGGRAIMGGAQQRVEHRKKARLIIDDEYFGGWLRGKT
jgi:hypothetical protein